MSNWFFDAPAGMKDFKDPQKWHDAMAAEANAIILGLVASVLNKYPEDVTGADVRKVAPKLAYINPVAIQPPADAETIAIAPWGAFPRAVERRGNWNLPYDPDDVSGNFRAVEHHGEEDIYGATFHDFDGKLLSLPVRDRQDEYLEWVVRRNAKGKIKKAIFVAEGYDYYSALFEHDEKLVVEMYKEFTGKNKVTADDLRAKRGIKIYSGDEKSDFIKPGQFNPRNRFNLNPGIVHLSHNANSLGAEINLAGVSGLARKTVSGTTLQPGNSELLLCCSAGGDPNRNSDPLIGEQAYTQVLEKRHYTLANPVGLYIAGVEEQRLTLENGDIIPREWWRVIRGADLWDSTKSRVLRLELEVPAGKKFVLGDLLVDGNPLKFGGQLAKLLSVHLFVTRWKRSGRGIGPVIGCNATCCRKTGAQELVITEEGKCLPGFKLAFKGLIPSPSASLFRSAGDSLPPKHTNIIRLKTRL